MNRLIKVLSNDFGTLIYSNLFTKCFEQEKVKSSNEIEKLAMQNLYDVYSKKNLWIMHMVKRDGGWDFRNPVEKGNHELAKSAILKAPKKAMKQASADSFVPLAAASYVVKLKVDLVIALLKQL